MASPPFSYIEDSAPGLHRVFNSVDVLGNITLDMTYTSRRFYEANPKLCAAFIAAMNEANALIANDRKRAAEIYLAVSKQKSSSEEIIKILSDPNSRFSTVPDGIMKYADFMANAVSPVVQEPSATAATSCRPASSDPPRAPPHRRNPRKNRPAKARESHLRCRVPSSIG